MSLSNTIRLKLAEKVGPCPTCGHQKMTVAKLAEEIGQSDSSVGRFLNGGSPSVGLLDAADAYLWRATPDSEAYVAARWPKGWEEPATVAMAGAAEATVSVNG